MGAFLAPPATAQAPGKYKNFRVAIYARRSTVTQWANPQTLATAYEEMSHQVKFDKVYLEIATGGQVPETIIDPIKKFFIDRGILVSAGAVTGATYASQNDRDRLKAIAETAARHFDELILDDWFFTASKTAADIAAKGTKSWTQYRLELLDNVALNQLIKPAKAINPKFHLIIKYPNWYEHFQGLGYDLDVEPKIFDGIYTGIETRDPIYSEQHLQQYESYSLTRYLENIKPGGNDGVWVDHGCRYADRYAEQIWDAAFAKTKEITLWHWEDGLSPINNGPRSWESAETSLDLKKVRATYVPPAGSKSQAMTGAVAGDALTQVDSFLDKLGKPVGIPACRPPHAIGEEFLHDYLGMIGIPIDLHPTLPATGGDVCILTEAAKHDPDIVKKIKARLGAGSNVVITSGLLRALNGKGIEDISEFEITDQKVGVTEFMGRGGQPIAGAKLDSPIFFPVIHFLTNQSWGEVNGYDGKSPQNAYPIVISDVYDKGTFYVLAIPDNVADLYRLPAPVLNAIRNQIMGKFPYRLTDAPSQVSLFAYDNNSFVVQSFLPAEVTVTASVPVGASTLTDLLSGQKLSPAPAPAPPAGRMGGGGGGRRGAGTPGTRFSITIPPHSYRAFTVQK